MEIISDPIKSDNKTSKNSYYNQTEGPETIGDESIRAEQKEYFKNFETDTEEGELAVDVYETDDAVIIQSTIAGVSANDLSITLSEDMLTIKGKRKRGINVPEHLYLYQECFWGPFSRSIILPVDVQFDKIDANIKNGILTLVLPKSHKEKSKIIKVKNLDEE